MYTLLIPKEKSLREKKTGRNTPFWKGYWEKRLAENPIHYQNQYKRRVRHLDRTVNQINEKYKELGKKYYVEARFDDFVDSKTKEPAEIWKESGVQIVETREDGSVTLSGSSDDFKKLSQFIKEANFEVASVERYSKKQNLSREIFSVTSIFDKNDSADKRISKEIADFIRSDDQDSINCILTVYFDRRLTEYDGFYKILVKKVGVQKISKINPKYFINNMSFRGNLGSKEIKEILEDPQCNFISFVKPTIVFGVQRTTPNNDPSSLQIGRPLTDENVVVIDSGINNTVINRFIAHRENLLGTGDVPNTNHGTSVASRLLFGDDIFSASASGNKIYPTGKIIDIQVIHQDRNQDLFVPDDRLMNAIEQSVRRYGQNSTIFNLSISAEQQVDELNVNEITEMIDDYSNKNDILFVCAVGNQKANFPLGYNKIFNTSGIDCHIASPSDAINALSVGAIASVADDNSICNEPNHPSPFTRKGGIRNDIKKPELVAPGGNIKTDPADVYSPTHLQTSHRVYGVHVIDNNGFNLDVGTSFSAPIISRECVRLLDYLKKSSISSHLPAFNSNKANLVKALLIHSTERISQVQLKNKGLKRAYGWGRSNSQEIIKDDDNQVTIVYADKINFSEKKQKVLIKLPDFLLDKPVEIVFTLVYNPPVNKNFKEYKMIDLQPSIGFIHPEAPEDGDESDGETYTRPNTPPHSWENYRSSHFNTIHFKKTRRKLTGLDLQVLVSMLVSNRLIEENLGHEEDISQNYALVVTIRDKSQSGQLRNEILNTNQFFELVENVVRVTNQS